MKYDRRICLCVIAQAYTYYYSHVHKITCKADSVVVVLIAFGVHLPSRPTIHILK